MNDSLSVVFMGAPDFAVPCLEALHRSRHRIARVVTQPDRPKGRGRKTTPTPVKAAAERLGYAADTPRSVKTPEFHDAMRQAAADVFAVVAYGHILPESLLQIPRLGAVNIHASLLPKYRGPAPIQWAIARGETETGVTAIQLVPELDAGPILLTQKTPVLPNDTSGGLHDRLAGLGADLLIRTLDGLARNELQGTPQDHARATFAPLLKKEDGRIDWTRPAAEIEQRIRGMTPWPGAFTFLMDRRIKVFRAEAEDAPTSAPPGTVLDSPCGEFHVAAGRGFLRLLEVQCESGKRMTADAFLCGCSPPAGTCLQ